jgi:hypothetical protein
MSLWESFWSNHSLSDVFWAAIWWLALCGITAWLARAKGHRPAGFFAIAFFFSPVFGLLAVVAARDLRSVAEAHEARDEFRQLLGPLMLQIDGIRGHLAVSSESPKGPPPPVPAVPPKRANAAPPPQTTAPRPEPALVAGASPS